jgi:hypothetical protein
MTFLGERDFRSLTTPGSRSEKPSAQPSPRPPSTDVIQKDSRHKQDLSYKQKTFPASGK